MPWTDEEERRLRELFWDHTYIELGEIFGISGGAVGGKIRRMGFPDKTRENELEWRYGVPLDWLLDTLHNTLGKSAKQMADELDVSRKWLTDQMDDRDIPRRGKSESEVLKWEQMTDAEREQQVRSAHERTRELVELGDDALTVWREENPDEAARIARENALYAYQYRNENGMKGVTGQDHHRWRGGKSIYDAVKRQLPGPSWGWIRTEHTADECRVCGTTDNLHLHHIVPIMAGGTNDEYNRMTLCRSCHRTVEAYTRRQTDVLLAE